MLLRKQLLSKGWETLNHLFVICYLLSVIFSYLFPSFILFTITQLLTSNN